MNIRIGGFGARLIVAGSILMLGAPAIGVASTSVETPQSHAREDAVVLSPSAEARLSHQTRAKTATASANAALPTTGDPGEVGQWGPVVDWPVVAIWATLLPNGKVLAYDSLGDQATETYKIQDHTRATVWDPATESQTEVWLRDGYNIFCSGFAHLPNGTIFVAGGNKNQQLDGIVQTHYFDWENDTWSLGENMSYARWYPSVTAMGNEEMLITSGGPPIPEVRQADGTLRQLSNASLSLPLYPWLDVAPDGRAFDSGPDQTMRSLDPSGMGAWQLWGNRDSINRTYGSHAMYDVGKILVAGGGKSTKTADVIDTNGATPTATPTGSMAYGRRQNNLTVLADGTVLVTGGNSSGATLVDLNAGVYAAELWSPATGQWTTLASERETRQYHSTALLLPDGRVLSAGGGICGECDKVGYLNKNAQIFSPPYLFAKDGSGALAPRPTVAAAPGTVIEDTKFTVSTPDAASISKVALVRLGAVTHSNNMEQRYVPVQFTASSDALTVTAPANVNIAPPGYYMLFLVNSAGVPSVAPILSVAPPGPNVTSVDPQFGPAAGGTSVTITGTDFNEVSAVQFGSTDAASFTVNSSTSITAISPPGTGTPNVTVTNPRGTSLASLVNRFNYAPVVTGVSPTSGTTAGGTAVTIKGSGFLAGASVTIGNAATSVNVVSETEITATTAATGAGSDEVVVTDAGGTSTGGPSYTYVVPPPPKVTRIAPTSGTSAGGTAVTIAGSGFLAGATVTIGNAATSVVVVSATKITAKTAATAAGADEVVVSDANGTSSGGPSYTYVAPPPPKVTSISPTSGTSAGGTAVTIVGSGFLAGATVTIGNAATSVVVVSATKITATTAATAAGVDSVVVSDANGTSTGGPSYIYVVPPPPKVTSIGPTSGPSAGGTAVTIKGSGFLAGATVTIGNAATSVVVVSSTKITATTAATAAGSDEVVVSDAHGTSTGGPSYTYVASTPPKVTSITPTSGTTVGGTAVTIKGNGFRAGATVTIGNAATSVVVVSSTKITATTAATAAGSDEVVVSDANGTSTGGPSYTYVSSPPPKVTSITPTSGTSAGGTMVTIKGSGFLAGATVTIGSAATSVVVVSATEITATTAATAAGSDEVVVSDANGTSTGGPSYTYVSSPPPKVTSITPTSGTSAGGTMVTIKGSGFLAGATVTIGSAATSVVVVSATEITATTAATAAGSDEAVVSDANGTSTGGPSYTYVTPPPTVTSISPTSGTTAGGTAVTITGSGFLAGATVTIGNGATSVVVVSETEITATTAATGAGADEVVVSDANGTSTGGPSYTYVAPPTVTSISPTSGPTAGGTAVTIKGSGFVLGATVTIGSEASEVLVISATEITATTTATAAGADEVVVTDANGTSTGGPFYTYVTPPPTVTSISPTSGTTAGGTTVTITGSGFLAGATVTIGNAATSVVVVSETEITATTAATGAGADEVVVSDAQGTSAGGPFYTYVAPPTVTSISPTSGPTFGGTAVTIEGSGFVLGATVTIGSEASEVLVISATEIKATTTATAPGADEVVVTDANGTSTGGPFYTYGD